ncbi:MAG: FG-GAP repeat domain-containing protein [Bacteroidia bacterium]
MLFLSATLVFAQVLVPMRTRVGVGTDTLPNPWVGGFTAPQFSSVDMDGDGIDELFVFDRMDNSVSFFKRQGNQWHYLAQAETLCPPQLSQWALLQDINHDNTPELFTNQNSNIRVYKGERQAGKIFWRRWIDTLYSTYYGYRTPLYCSLLDIPGFADIDGDGDMDILVYEILGALIEWHKNKAQELLGHPDTLILELQSACWGHVYEDYDPTTNQFTFNYYTCGTGQRRDSLSRTQHSGGTLCPLDLNGDGLIDILVGDYGPPNIIAGINTGTPQIAHIGSWDGSFPSYDVPIQIDYFPATFYVDATADGIPDLIAAPNTTSAVEDRKGIWLYENIARADSPHFVLREKGFLQNTQLDIGTAAAPTLCDLNRDTIPDLIFAGNYYTPSGAKARAQLYYGSMQGGTWHLILADSNWLHLDTTQILHPVFTVADVDGDARWELLMGTDQGNLWLWKENPDGTFSLVTSTFENINVQALAAPLWSDVDGDGDYDLLIGRRDGRISFYRKDPPSYTLVTDFLGQIRLTDTLNTLVGNTRPAWADISRDGTPELLVGNLTGYLRAYQPDFSQPTAPWLTLVSLPYATKWASPTTYKQADSLLLVVGTHRGGAKGFYMQGNPMSALLPDVAFSWEYTPYGMHLITSQPLTLTIYTPQGVCIQTYTLSPGDHNVPLPRGLNLINAIGTNFAKSWKCFRYE